LKEIIKLSLILGFVCVLASASLSLVYRHTETIIEQNQKRRLEESLEEVLPNISESPEQIVEGNLYEKLKTKLKKNLENLYEAKRADETLVYAASVSVGGYQGPIRLLVGFNPEESVVLGVKVLDHSETPGLGARIVTDETFLNELKGKLKDEYDTITGATISSKAVIGRIVSILECVSIDD